MPKYETEKCTNLRAVLRRFIRLMRRTDCEKPMKTTCRRPDVDQNRAYNIPMEFLNQYNIDEEDKKRTIEILASMPQNFTITKCTPGSTSPECSTESNTEFAGESTTESSTGSPSGSTDSGSPTSSETEE